VNLKKKTPAELLTRKLNRTLAVAATSLLKTTDRFWGDRPYFFNKRLPDTAWDIALQNPCVAHDARLPLKLDYLRKVYQESTPVYRSLKKE